MTRKTIVAGAAAALVLGGVAIAQTAPQNQTDPATSQGMASPSAADTTARSDAQTSGRAMNQAPAAEAYGSDTAAQSAAASDEASMRAGERG